MDEHFALPRSEEEAKAIITDFGNIPRIRTVEIPTVTFDDLRLMV